MIKNIFKKFNKQKLKIYRVFILFFLIIIGISALPNFFSIVFKLKEELTERTRDQQLNKKGDKEWSEEILKGGYILFFRHAERDRWHNYKIYDALETDTGNLQENTYRFAEKEYFKDAVCLNAKGKIQARSIKEVLEISKLPIGYVISSPSCRARQTAEIAFGGYQKLYRELVHKGPYYENQKARDKFLKNFLINLPIQEKTNTLISAHNGVIYRTIFENVKNSGFKLKEGGFFVISNKNRELKLMHIFDDFRKFSNNFFIREY